MALIPSLLNDKMQSVFLDELIILLEKAKIPVAAARGKTKAFLELFPLESFEEAQAKLKKYSDLNPEFREVYIYFLREKENMRKDILLERMQKLIHRNKIDEAVNLVK